MRVPSMNLISNMVAFNLYRSLKLTPLTKKIYDSLVSPSIHWHGFWPCWCFPCHRKQVPSVSNPTLSSQWLFWKPSNIQLDTEKRTWGSSDTHCSGPRSQRRQYPEQQQLEHQLPLLHKASNWRNDIAALWAQARDAPARCCLSPLGNFPRERSDWLRCSNGRVR